MIQFKRSKWIQNGIHTLIKFGYPLGLASCVVVGLEGARLLWGGGNGIGEGVIAALGLIGCFSLFFLVFSFFLWKWIYFTFNPTRLWIWILTLGCGSCIELWSIHQATLVWTRRFRQPTYQGLAIGLVGCGVGLILLLVLPWIAKGLIWIENQIRARLYKDKSFIFSPYQSYLQWIGIGIFFFLVWTLDSWLSLLFPLFKTLDLRPVQVGLVWIGSWLTFNVSLIPFPSFSVQKKGVAVSLIVWMCALGYTAFGLTDVGYRRLMRDTSVSHFFLTQMQRWTDFDGDGRSHWFHGGDCADDQRRIRVGAYDPIGKDWNCNSHVRKPHDQWANQAFIPSSKSIVSKSTSLPSHLLLITVDALRYDTSLTHFPLFRKWIDQAGLEFQNAYSAGASTYWSLPSLIGGKMPSRFKMERDQTPSRSEELLAEIFHSSGFETALFSNVTIFFVRGLRQGFKIPNFKTSKYTVHGAKPGSQHLTSSLIHHFKQRVQSKKKMMVWAHYYDLHDPYFKVPHFPSKSASNWHRYQAIARSIDFELDRLFKELKGLGLLDKMMVVITSDHGDEFKDHGHEYHGKTVYEEMVHVPLWIFDPRQKAQHITQPISHVDVGPTLVDLMGVRPFKRSAGKSWGRWLLNGQKGPPPNTAVFFEVLPDQNYSHHQIGLRRGDMKVIYDLGSGTFEVYNLKTDPQERFNLGIDSLKDQEIKPLLMEYVDQHLAWIARGESGIRKPWASPPRKRR